MEEGKGGGGGTENRKKPKETGAFFHGRTLDFFFFGPWHKLGDYLFFSPHFYAGQSRIYCQRKGYARDLRREEKGERFAQQQGAFLSRTKYERPEEEGGRERRAGCAKMPRG